MCLIHPTDKTTAYRVTDIKESDMEDFLEDNFSPKAIDKINDFVCGGSFEVEQQDLELVEIITNITAVDYFQLILKAT